MPQLDISTFLPQLFWLIVSFGLLYIILSQFFLPKLIQIGQARDQQILDALAITEKNKAEAYRLKEEYEKNLAEAIQQKNVMINNALKDIAQMVESKLAEHNHKLEEMTREAEKNLQNFGTVSAQDINKIAMEATHNIVSTIFALKIEKADIQKAIEQQHKERYYDA